MKGTTFENELRRIFDDMECFEEGSMKYVGRAFYGKIDDELRLKAQYISRDISNHYSALKLEVIKRNEGVVDSNVIRFEELWGKKHTTNPNFKEGVSPHLWHSEERNGAGNIRTFVDSGSSRILSAVRLGNVCCSIGCCRF